MVKPRARKSNRSKRRSKRRPRSFRATAEEEYSALSRDLGLASFDVEDWVDTPTLLEGRVCDRFVVKTRSSDGEWNVLLALRRHEAHPYIAYETSDKLKASGCFKTKMIHEQELVPALDLRSDMEKDMMHRTYMIFDRASSDLFDFIVRSGPDKRLRIYPTVYEHLSAALRFLHETCRIAHCDVKLENVLVFDGYTFKLADFGLSALTFPVNSDRGTARYLAPEKTEGTKPITAYSYEYGLEHWRHADAYSLGVTLYALRVGAHPWEAIGKASLKHYMTDLVHGAVQRGMDINVLELGLEKNIRMIERAELGWLETRCMNMPYWFGTEQWKPVAIRTLRRWAMDLATQWRRHDLRHYYQPGTTTHRDAAP